MSVYRNARSMAGSIRDCHRSLHSTTRYRASQKTRVRGNIRGQKTSSPFAQRGRDPEKHPHGIQKSVLHSTIEGSPHISTTIRETLLFYQGRRNASLISFTFFAFPPPPHPPQRHPSPKRGRLCQRRTVSTTCGRDENGAAVAQLPQQTTAYFQQT